jgi:hypothetical protein
MMEMEVRNKLRKTYPHFKKAYLLGKTIKKYMDGSTSFSMSSQDSPDIREMSSRIGKLLVLHIPLDGGKRIAYKKVDVWEQSRFISGTNSAGPYEPGLKDPRLKDTVFKVLAERGDIEDLGDRVRITEQGAAKPEYQDPQGVYLRKRYLNP